MTAKPLPSTAAVTGLKETLDFFNDPSFAQRRFDAYGDVFATTLLAQRIVFIRGERAITELLNQGDSLEGWWPESVKKLIFHVVFQVFWPDSTQNLMFSKVSAPHGAENMDFLV